MNELWFCQDCTFVAVNGDLEADAVTDARRQEIDEGCDRLADEGGHLAANFDSESGEGLMGFSRRECDCCGTALAGYRARFAQFEKAAV